MPQGSPLSPILVNLHLHHLLDKKWVKLGVEQPLLRYADDLLIVCESRDEAVRLYELLNKLVNQAGYQLKTDLANSIFDASSQGEGFTWLGYEVQLKPFTVDVGDEKWLELRGRLKDVIEDHPGTEEEYVDDLIYHWAKQAIAPMSHDQLGGLQEKIESLLSDVGVPTEYLCPFDELHRETKRGWRRAIDKARKTLPALNLRPLAVTG